MKNFRIILVTLCVYFVTIVLAMNGYEPAQDVLCFTAIILPCVLGAIWMNYRADRKRYERVRMDLHKKMLKAA